MEVRQETDAVKLHIQKVAGFFSAMRHFAAELIRNGHRVVYLRLDDPNNEQSFDANLNPPDQRTGRDQISNTCSRTTTALTASWPGWPRVCPFRRLSRYGAFFNIPQRSGRAFPRQKTVPDGILLPPDAQAP
jgi:hypothetical protein